VCLEGGVVGVCLEGCKRVSGVRGGFVGGLGWRWIFGDLEFGIWKI